jgi:hypothetical protein
MISDGCYSSYHHHPQPTFFFRTPLASGDSPIKIIVDVSVVEGELSMTSVTVELPLTETCAAVKAKLVAMGVRSIPANRMKLQLGEMAGKKLFFFGKIGESWSSTKDWEWKFETRMLFENMCSMEF